MCFTKGKPDLFIGETEGIRFQNFRIFDILLAWELIHDENVKKYTADRNFNIRQFFEDLFSEYTLIVVENERIGMIRESNGVISIAIFGKFQNKGYGSEAIRKYSNGKLLTAIIKKDNKRSIKAFYKAGYILDYYSGGYARMEKV